MKINSFDNSEKIPTVSGIKTVGFVINLVVKTRAKTLHNQA